MKIVLPLQKEKTVCKTILSMKRTLLTLLAVAFALVSATASARPEAAETTDSAALRRMALFAGNMLTYNNNFTQEKVYLHLDNNGYIAGEHLWFKAYVFKAASLLPTDMSKVLYVELLNPDGQLVERKTLRVDNGRTYGDFDLNPMECHQGFYELRAYTRAMLNWNQAYIYSRVIPIFEQPKDTVNFTGMVLHEYDYDPNPGPETRPAPEPMATDGTLASKDLMLTFYPEGGHITRSVPSRVAYKFTDRQGLPADCALSIHSNDGQTIAESHVLHDGMGDFQLPATWTGGYAEVKTEADGSVRFNLPSPRLEGCDISTTCSSSKGLDITLRPSQGMTGRTLGLSVTCRGTLLYFNTVTPDHETEINIPYGKLRDGIAQITLFTAEGQVLSERLIWVEPHKAAPKMEIRQNQEVYHPFQPVVLDISLHDSEGQPLQADFSLAVRDAATEVGPDSHGLWVEMLLSSELKGYIHNPDYYFESADETHRQALDLLLMVQGWRRYQWQEMSGVEPFQLKQPAEDGLTLIGTLSSTKAAEHSLEREGSLDVNFLMQTINGTKVFSVQTDSTGRFAVQLPDFNDDAPTVMTVTNNKDKRVYTHFILDRDFAPAAMPYEPLQTASSVAIMESRVDALAHEPATFEWQDTIPDQVSRLIQLGEVTVKGKKRPGYNPGARFTWMGGESATKGSAAIFYNLRNELDRYLDQGEEVPVVWEWLSKSNKNFYYDITTGEMWYRGRQVVVVVDNNFPGASMTAAYPTEGEALTGSNYAMNRFQSLSIVDNEAVASNILQHTLRDANNPMPSARVVFFLYTRTDMREPNSYRRGTRWINLHGYSLCTEFYSPDYRQQDIPTDTDHRRTLYWNPSLVTSPEGKAQVIFYTSSRPDERLHINAQGIAVNGQMVEGK